VVGGVGRHAGERHDDLLERRAGQLGDEPAAKRPGRIVLGTGVELVHGRQSGTVLPGFMMLCGSSARLIVFIRSTPSPCSATSAPSLWTRMPCSRVHVPPMAMARSDTRFASVSAFSRS